MEVICCVKAENAKQLVVLCFGHPFQIASVNGHLINVVCICLRLCGYIFG